jgi:hypothetical protein
MASIDRDKSAEDYTLRRIRRMASVDEMQPGQRRCVHDFGLNIVTAFSAHGITREKAIRHIVKTILDDLSPLNHSSSKQRAYGHDL